MIRSYILTAAVGALAILGGCGKSNGEEYLGKWENKAHNDRFEITRNGDGFILTSSNNKRIPATYKDGVLQITSFFGPRNLAYDKQHDSLLLTDEEFSRVK
jgi:hypothetical protein